MKQTPKAPIDSVVEPIQKFIQQENSGGLVLGASDGLLCASKKQKKQY